MEQHPHLHLFDNNKKWNYLIIGTFPPNTAIRPRDKLYIDYFYGNKGFLWKIIHDIYHASGYDFFTGTKAENLREIQRWQHDYCVGLTDTIHAVTRRRALSSDDADFIDIVLNYTLKEYVLAHAAHLQKIIFTSSTGKNSAFNNFKKIMGPDIILLSGKLATGLPSPSGSANISFFNTNQEATLGLANDFYHYITTFRKDLLPQFENRWEIKKKRKSSLDKSAFTLPSTPKGLVGDYKVWRYQQVLPDKKCH